jgi:HlyD family secretion protein
MKRSLIVLVIIAAIGAGAATYYMRRSAPQIVVNTSPVTRGDIVDTVGSTGTLQAVTTVQVGSQVSGNISWLGADFNSIVKKGQVIAKLDPSLLDAQVQQAKANLVKSQADLDRNKVALADAQQKYTRAKELSVKELIAQSDLDAAKIALDSAQAQIQSSDATVTQARASLNQAQVNLDHTIIEAPIDGIVTQRSVDVGQTVASSLQAPTLFIIAADLTKMQVSANIDESDVGRIRPGQHVTFRVDAYPTDQFEGTVVQIRLQPVVQSNVTTYGTIINVPNADLKLKPGMTANLKVEIAKRTNALRVPNAGIRFRPTQEIFAALNQPVPPEALAGAGRGGRTASGQRGAGSVVADNNGAPASGGRGTTPQTAGATPPTPSQPAAAASLDGGRIGQGGGGAGRGGGGGGRGGDPAQQMDRFKAMTPDQQQQFIARIKSRGQDASTFEAAIAKPGRAAKPAGAQPTASDSLVALLQPKYGTALSGATVDALFAPLPTIETRGRLWLYIDQQLKPANVRLGITDGTNTELIAEEIGEEIPVGTEVVTSVSGVGATRPAAGAAGNPFQQGGGNNRGGQGGFGGAGGRGR